MAGTRDDGSGDDTRRVPLGEAPTQIADATGPADVTIAADASEPVGPARPDAAEIERGAVIGRFVVLARLGAGGMGVVYAAYDPELDRKVALKLLRVGVGGDVASSLGRTRLLREAQALARLSHPHVVAIFDVGTLADRVWLAMEHVDGRTLGAWLGEVRPGWSEIVAVMQAVAEGLAAAHAVGLVHRDLKPDNIMVGRDGRVRVMDFGLARTAGSPELAPDDDLMRSTAEHPALSRQVTQAGAVMGTPAYMAPEQWRGEETDARADQFAFCVTLWEAVHGARPFAGDTAMALASAVMLGELRAAPRRTGVPVWLRRVLVRGLAPEPERRFPSMAALLEALARGRARGRKLALGLGLGLVALTLALVPVWHRWSQARRAAACDAAGDEIAAVWNPETRAALADAMISTGVSYAAVSHAKLVPWVDRWTAEWSQVRTRTCREAEVEATRTPELYTRSLACLDERREELAALLTVLGDGTPTAIQRAVPAAANLSPLAACADPVALARRPLPPSDPELHAQVQALRRELMHVQGLYAAARYTEGLAQAEALLTRAEALGHAPLTVEARVLVGELAEKGRALERAEAALIAAYVEAGALGIDELAARATTDLVFVTGSAAVRYEAGVQWSHTARMLLRRLGKSEDMLAARLDNALAATYKVHGDFDAAQQLYEQALEIRVRTLGPDHPEVAMLLNNLANLHAARGSDGAQALYERALKILEATLGTDHPHVAATLNNLGGTLYLRSRLDEARAMHERALQIRERVYGPEHPDVATSLMNLGLISLDRRDLATAYTMQARALEIRDRVLPPGHPETADARSNLAAVCIERGDLAEAEALELRALAAREQALGPEHLDVAHSLINLARIAELRGREPEALALFRRALQIREQGLDADSLDLSRIRTMVAQSELILGHTAPARPLLTAALATQERVLGPQHVLLAETLHALGELERLEGALDRAQALEERALALWLAGDSQFAALAVTGLGELALARGRDDDAVALFERALDLRVAGNASPRELAEARFNLAAALARTGRDRPRALELARQATAVLADLDPQASALLTRLRRRAR